MSNCHSESILVETGETVRIVNEPYLLGWRNGELYFEAHAPPEDSYNFV